jgi:hypothetical protein
MVPFVLTLLFLHADPADTEYERLRERTRQLVDRTCGECHDGGRSSALPKALAIFDTRDAAWAARMTHAQLRSASSRLASDIVPTLEKAEAKPLHVTVLERAEFDAFVAAEMGRRAEHR